MVMRSGPSREFTRCTRERLEVLGSWTEGEQSDLPPGLIHLVVVVLLKCLSDEFGDARESVHDRLQQVHHLGPDRSEESSHLRLSRGRPKTTAVAGRNSRLVVASDPGNFQVRKNAALD